MPTVILNLVFAISSLRLGTIANSASWDWVSAQEGWDSIIWAQSTSSGSLLEPVAYLTVPLTSYIDADWVLNVSNTKRNLPLWPISWIMSCLHHVDQMECVNTLTLIWFGCHARALEQFGRASASQMDFHCRMRSVTNCALAYVVMYAAGHGAHHDKCMFDSLLWNSSGQGATEQALNDWGFKKKNKKPNCVERARNITDALNVKLILPMNEFNSRLLNPLYSFCIKQRFTVKTQPWALSLYQNFTLASLEQSLHHLSYSCPLFT